MKPSHLIVFQVFWYLNWFFFLNAQNQRADLTTASLRKGRVFKDTNVIPGGKIKPFVCYQKNFLQLSLTPHLLYTHIHWIENTNSIRITWVQSLQGPITTTSLLLPWIPISLLTGTTFTTKFSYLLNSKSVKHSPYME